MNFAVVNVSFFICRSTVLVEKGTNKGGTKSSCSSCPSRVTCFRSNAVNGKKCTVQRYERAGIEDQKNMKIPYFYIIKIIFSINNFSFEFFILNSWISIFYLSSSGRIVFLLNILNSS